MRFAPCLALTGLLALTPLVHAEDASPEASIVVTGSVTASYGGEAGPHAARFLIDGLERGEGPLIGASIFVVSKEPLAEKKRLRLQLGTTHAEGYRVLASQAASESQPEASPADLAQLEALVETMITVAKTSDWKALSKLVIPLKLKDPATLFERVFPPASAKLVTAEYAKTSKSMIVDFRKTLSAMLDEGAGPYRCFLARGNKAVGLQRRARFAMQSELPLYTVQFDRAGVRLWSFAYVEGSWRYLGKLQALPREPLVLKVRITGGTIDPKQLQGQTLTLTVKNAGEETVLVPSTYDGRVVRLVGRGRDHFWSSRLRPSDPPAQTMVPLKPKEERVLLEVSLAEILRRDARWSWDWGSHPVPPQSPIHRWRAMGFEDDTLFYVAIEAGQRTLHSKPVRILIRPR
ncbi:MAG: hypothetical protein JKY65_32810 [Planctomycetes bacterium]|nr:hypothetical protein [Planctomycetota bacterium]